MKYQRVTCQDEGTSGRRIETVPCVFGAIGGGTRELLDSCWEDKDPKSQWAGGLSPCQRVLRVRSLWQTRLMLPTGALHPSPLCGYHLSLASFQL